MIDVTALPAMACGRCLCFVENAATKGQGGECHLNPPAVVVTRSKIMTAGGGNDHINTVFTPVPVNSWCLRFIDKEQYLAGMQAGIDKESGSNPAGNH